MIELFTYLLIGSVVAYGVFTILVELLDEIRYMRIKDDRDTEEKVIAGEETSEVALDYLKIAASLESDDEAR
jgi:hypothetical protein|tara:strand:- start:280 stop:495 length:216 start_codon:yes stop_codon:yes gene_type:complete